MSLANLSLRHKLPLWGGLLILLTVLAVTVGNLVLTRESIKRNMLARSEILGRSLSGTLYSAISQDDVWRAYEIINFPIQAEKQHPAFQLEDFVVLDAARQVFISTDNKRYPMLARLDALGAPFARLQARLARDSGHIQIIEAERILMAIPLLADGVTLGTLVLVHPGNYYQASFDRVLRRTAWTTLLVLLIMLPLIWYWGMRMATPLSLLAARMEELGQKLPAPLPQRIYSQGDELGRLFRVYEQMRQELLDKEIMERQIVKSDRLAALGRLTASIAHEINNPLGGLLTALDTLRRHSQPDPVLDRVVPLLERGLHQIKDIVAALLVEARAKSRRLTHQDVDDVHTLLAQEARKRSVAWEWHNDLLDTAALPATLVRQLLINLLLNAVQAAEGQGRVRADIRMAPGGLHIEIGNSGQCIPPDLMDHLFEPFTGRNEEGLGLGLWITYQIVQQLHGHIDVDSRDGWTRFRVDLPDGETLCSTATSA